MRDTIFISHATPQDNEFALWLSSRLGSMGYHVWIDKNALLGGEKFWKEIDLVIRNSAAKWLLVYSKNICKQGSPGHLKDGIYKEHSLAESIEKQNNIKDFIILLNTDNSPYNLFIGADCLNQIDFSKNWAEGLRLLIKKFEKDDIFKESGEKGSDLSNWFENQYICKNGINARRELYYSSLWPIKNLPDKFFIFQFENESEAKSVYLQNHKYPVSKISNILSSFSCEIPITYQKEDEIVNAILKNHETINISDVIAKVPKSLSSNINPQNHLKTLLSRVFHLLMKKRQLNWYELAKQNLAYYFTPRNLQKGRTKFQFPFRHQTKRKVLFGKYKELGKWHFALSSRIVFEPMIAFSLKSHLIFTTNGFKAWDNKEQIHAHRRSKGKYWFNEDWRDLYLAFLNALKDENGVIEQELDENYFLKMDSIPMFYWADFGYEEPKSKKRQDILIENEEEEPDA